jgi:hypothetical protein
MTPLMDPEGIDCCRRIGRNEEENNTTIGLLEFESLCATAEAYWKHGGVHPLPIEKHSGSKYLRRINSSIEKGEFVKADVYAVLEAFQVTCPARQHAIKKLLATGLRDKGSQLQDLKEALDAVSRAVELQQGREE